MVKKTIDMSNFYSPLRYPGGKNCIFSFASKFFYENDLIGCSYAEPYAGGAGLALRLLFEGYVDHIYLNDLDKFIYSFWETILNQPIEFCLWINELDISIENWEFYKSIQSTPDNYTTFEIAQSAFFLNRTNISGVLKGGVIGGKSQEGKYKINARFNKQDLIKRIEKLQTVRNRITISNLDGIKFLKEMNRKKEEIFIYLDPPYYQKGFDLYMNYYKENDHKKLSRAVKTLSKKWMVSYDNKEFIINLYKENNKISYRLSQSASNRIGDEIIIFSQDLYYEDSIKSLNEAQLIS